MTLSEWASQNRDQVVAEAESRRAVPSLLALVARELADAEGVPSDDGRLEHAFAACLAAARAALAASGYRLRATAHHYLAIESLAYTLAVGDGQVGQLQAYRRMRSQAMYNQVGVASSEVARAALASARALADRLRAWLATEHPDLLSK